MAVRSRSSLAAPTVRMTAVSSVLLSIVALVLSSLSLMAPARAESRGELLYKAHCIACHTSQIHWRKNKAATDWASLKVQVRRWQGRTALAWNDSDILEVARYLNETVYHFEQTTDPVSSRALGRGVLADARARRPQ